ncbi:MAG: DNA replication/repair protein RecF, partial [Gammaproteobacteria bacterium]|nr:DNA replication/repair protein RecF [Gammaproteobacteria bacterium]
MPVKHLSVRDFRCFESVALDLDPDTTWIVGQNASGKTSLLEALFFLGHGRSFRSGRAERVIRSGAERFELVARLEGEDGARERVLGMARGPQGGEARLGGEDVRSFAEVAQALPVVILDSEMNRLVSEGPGHRRRWLDWGLFHVEPGFLETWRSFQRALRQRNQALKQGMPDRAILPWTDALSKAGEELHELRQAYFQSLQELCAEYLQAALPEIPIELSYRRGWAQDESYRDSIEKSHDRDREFGNTRPGPHRADIRITSEGIPATERVSRGQQKMLAGALWLAQVKMFGEGTGRRSLLLVDDLAAELDGDRLARFLELLGRQQVQQVLTAIDH